MTNELTDQDFLRAGELAQATGISTDTLRHYERKGVLACPGRSRNGYREYPPEALERVRLIRRALAIGFTLDELARILKARDQGGAPCREVRALAAEKLDNLETRLDELIFVRDELRATLANWDTLLNGKVGNQRAGLLEALTSAPSPNHQTSLAPVWRKRKIVHQTNQKRKNQNDEN